MAPRGPDDDPEFLAELDRVIRGDRTASVALAQPGVGVQAGDEEADPEQVEQQAPNPISWM